MGSLTLPKLSPAQIAQLYLDGKPLSWLVLRSGLTHYRVRDVLRDAGVPLRTSLEVTVLRTAERRRHYQRRLDQMDQHKAKQPHL